MDKAWVKVETIFKNNWLALLIRLFQRKALFQFNIV